MTTRNELVFEGSCLTVALLPGSPDVHREWSEVDSKKLIAALEAADAQLIGPAARVRGERLVKLSAVSGGWLWELKGPPRGKTINRALCFNPRGWEMYVALAAVKKTQKLPVAWVTTATRRIERARDEGHPDG